MTEYTDEQIEARIWELEQCGASLTGEMLRSLMEERKAARDDPRFWWNGLSDEMKSFRKTEDDGHDIPLYAGCNPHSEIIKYWNERIASTKRQVSDEDVERACRIVNTNVTAACRVSPIRMRAALESLPAQAVSDGYVEYARNGWKEAGIAWTVCASIHRQYAKGKDALFTTRQSDYVKHAEDAKGMFVDPPSHCMLNAALEYKP